MKIDLSKLIDRTVYKLDFDNTLELKKLDLNLKEILFAGPINVKGSFYKTDEEIYLDSVVTYKYYEKCARCLEEFVNRVETVLSGRVLRTSKSSDVEKDEVVIYYDSDEVDLTEQIITSIMLSLPMKSLCKDDCKGLCPVCGVNMNKENCDCDIQEVDPRLAKLKDLFK